MAKKKRVKRMSTARRKRRHLKDWTVVDPNDIDLDEDDDEDDEDQEDVDEDVDDDDDEEDDDEDDEEDDDQDEVDQKENTKGGKSPKSRTRKSTKKQEESPKIDDVPKTNAAAGRTRARRDSGKRQNNANRGDCIGFLMMKGDKQSMRKAILAITNLFH